MKNKRTLIVLVCSILAVSYIFFKLNNKEDKSTTAGTPEITEKASETSEAAKLSERTSSTPTITIAPNNDITLYNTKPNLVGNTSGNLSNWGQFAQQGKWMYFSFLNRPDSKLYRAMLDGETGLKEMPGVVGANFINAAGEWVYYTTRRSNGIFKIRTDGLDGDIIDVKCHGPIAVAGDNIYYPNDSGINKIDTYGIANTLLTGDVIVGPLNYSDNYIYYIKNMKDKYIPEEDYKLFRIDTNGQNRRKLTNDICQKFIVEGDWIYYINSSDNSRLYRVKKDGTQRKLLIKESIYNLNILNGTIYYVPTADLINIYSFNTDTMTKSKLTSNKIPALRGSSISNDSLPASTDSYLIDKVNIIDNISIIGDYLFCNAVVNEKPALLRINLDGSMQKVIN